jgi:hypothetical protein
MTVNGAAGSDCAFQVFLNLADRADCFANNLPALPYTWWNGGIHRPPVGFYSVRLWP